MRTFILIIATALSMSTALAQDPTDLYLFQLQTTPDHVSHVYQPKFLSGFNPNGYTNQPWFVSNDALLVSVRTKGDTQNDIYMLSTASNKIRQITRTANNEYSPRIQPDGMHLSVVRQVEGDSIDQQVY